MVYSSLASYFQGGIIFLVSIISYIWVLLGTSHLPDLGYPGSCFLQWPVWNLAYGVSILLAPPSWGLLPSPPLSLSVSGTVPTYVWIILLTSYFGFSFLLTLFFKIPIYFEEEQCSAADPVRVLCRLGQHPATELQSQPLMILSKVSECSTGWPWTQDPPFFPIIFLEACSYPGEREWGNLDDTLRFGVANLELLDMWGVPPRIIAAINL